MVEMLQLSQLITFFFWNRYGQPLRLHANILNHISYILFVIYEKLETHSGFSGGVVDCNMSLHFSSVNLSDIGCLNS